MKIIKAACIHFLVLIVLTVLVSIWSTPLEAFRAIFGGFYILLLPGLVLTYVFFDENDLAFFERLPFGFALSLATVPLVIFPLFRLGMEMNPWTILGPITGLIFVECVIILIRKRHFIT